MTSQSSATGTLYVISAPSGGGKTSLVSQLMECTADITRVITHTTRTPRRNEENGVHYHFVSQEEFEALQQQDAFVEYAEVFGNLYGTSKQEIHSKLIQGQDVMLVIDWQGAEQVRHKMPEAVNIFILPPSIDALRARLLKRNQDSITTIDERMQDALNQIRHYQHFDYIIINDDFDIALANLRAIIMAERLKTPAQEQRYARLIQDLFVAE